MRKLYFRLCFDRTLGYVLIEITRSRWCVVLYCNHFLLLCDESGQHCCLALLLADECKGWMTRFQNWTSSDISKQQRYQARRRDNVLGLPNSKRASKDESGTCNTKEWATPRTLAQVMAAGLNLFAVTGEEASVGPTPTAAFWQHNSWYGLRVPGWRRCDIEITVARREGP